MPYPTTLSGPLQPAPSLGPPDSDVPPSGSRCRGVRSRRRARTRRCRRCCRRRGRRSSRPTATRCASVRRIGGVDVLGYHAYAAAATWLASGARRCADAAPRHARLEALLRLRPLAADAVRWRRRAATSFFAGPVDDRRARRRRRRCASARSKPASSLPIRRVRRLAPGARARCFAPWTSSRWPAGDVSRDRAAVRAALAHDHRAHVYGYSISPEARRHASARPAKRVRRALGSIGDATTLTADVRAYLPGVAPHHVVAAAASPAARRAATPTLGRTFLLGGAAPNAGVLDFGRDAISLLRGFPRRHASPAATSRS